MLQQLLNDEMGWRRLSIRQTAREIGVAHTTLIRILNGSAYDLDTAEKISNWLSVDLSALIEVEISHSQEVADRLAILLDRSPNFKAVIEEVAAKITRGELNIAILEQTAVFIRFQMLGE